jgi:hypothetical protein
MGLLVLLSSAGAGACASTPERAGPPDLTPVAGSPAGAQGKLYADCVGQAAAAGTYDRTSAGDGHLLRFNCSGEPARAFYIALEGWSAARDSQWTADGRTWRSTAKVQKDLFGVDYCSSAAEADHQCVLVMNGGDFLGR